MKTLLLLATALFCRHDESITSSRIEISGSEAIVTFTLSMEDLESIEDGGVFAYLSTRYCLWNDGERCRAELVGAVSRPASYSPKTPVSLTLRFVSSAPIRNLKVRCEAMRDRVKDPKHIVDFPDGRTVLFEKEKVEVEWAKRGSFLTEFGSFVGLGVEHILTGWDHLTFLITLLVIATSAGKVVKLVTSFTVAHSITLVLTVLGVIDLPSGFVEASIAASIVYVALENFFVKEAKWRWLLTFAFGLIHGMGFAGVLVEMNLANPASALLGFNLGVELGQLGVVAIVLPILLVIRKHREAFYNTWMVRSMSGAAAAAGIFWLIERVI